MSEYHLTKKTAEVLELILKYDTFTTMPHGLTREEKLKFLKDAGEEKMNYILEIESQLAFDDSEYSKQYVGTFEQSNIKALHRLIDGYWMYMGEEVLTVPIAENILSFLKDNSGYYSFEIKEDDSTVDFESCRRIFTISITPEKK